MLPASSSPLKAVPGARADPILTYVEGDYDKLVAEVMQWLLEDGMEKKITVPEYCKERFALNANTSDGTIAGSVSGHTAWGELVVEMLCVNPDVKVAGTMERLLQGAEEHARRNGCSRVRVETYNLPTRLLCEKVGFHTFATHEDYPVGHNHYLMEKVWEEGAPLRETNDAVAVEAGNFHALQIAPGKQEETDERLSRWAEKASLERNIPGVEPHHEQKYGYEAYLPDHSVGAACCFETLWGAVHISFLATHPHHKGERIGSVFMEYLCGVARKQGCRRVQLETMSWQAQGFYEKLGFKVVGIQRAVPEKGNDRIYLERVL